MNLRVDDKLMVHPGVRRSHTPTDEELDAFWAHIRWRTSMLRVIVNIPSTARKKDSHWKMWLHFSVHEKYNPDGFAATDTLTDANWRERRRYC